MTECYAMVRGSALRITALHEDGNLVEPIEYGVTKSLTKVTIDETTDGGGNEVLRGEAGDARIVFTQDTEQVGYTAGVDFMRTDPGVLRLLTGNPIVMSPQGHIVGFDANTRVPVNAFALEVWSKLDRSACITAALGFGEGAFGEMPFGDGSNGSIAEQMIALGFGEGPFGMMAFGDGSVGQIPRLWGYTVFPYISGGYLSGFTFANAAISFRLTGARIQRGTRWAVGPHDLNGLRERHTEHVSGNDWWRQTLVALDPPVQQEGTSTFDDAIYGGDASETSADIVIGGSADYTSPWIINGGRA